MATLAHNLMPLTAPAGERAARENAVAPEDLHTLRPLPNEEVFLYIKRFDNTGVIRQADPRAGRQAWKAIGGSCVAATLLIGLLLPGAYRLLAGYQIDRLRQAQSQGSQELRTLEYEEAKLVSIERINELARSREFTPPASGQVEILDGLQQSDEVASLEHTSPKP